MPKKTTPAPRSLDEADRSRQLGGAERFEDRWRVSGYIGSRSGKPDRLLAQTFKTVISSLGHLGARDMPLSGNGAASA
jgi:hypothetical protein